jgi:phosphopentomutase
MKQFKRVFLIVLDSVGIGELPDAKEYNDEGAHTLGHIAEKMDGLNVPNLANLGLGHIEHLQGVSADAPPAAAFGKMKEISLGKDTTTGHWEIMGLRVETPFKTWPNGFPDGLIKPFSKRIGRGVLGNKPASGTEIIEELGEQHMKTGDVIVYTSADSVFQVAAHEEIVPLEELYKICEVAREMTLNDEYSVVRVIARPFIGEPGNFTRTPNRHDYSVSPPGKTVMNSLQDAGYSSIAIGKISDIYAGEGVTESIKTKSNMDGVDKLLGTMKKEFTGLSFVNLVDFDAMYGHRRNPIGYGEALEEFDRRLPEILDALQDDDLLIITADHGNDPVHHGTDHTREYVPLLVYHNGLTGGKNLGVRETFADIGATIADNFKVTQPRIGTSFLKEITES